MFPEPIFEPMLELFVSSFLFFGGLGVLIGSGAHNPRVVCVCPEIYLRALAEILGLSTAQALLLPRVAPAPQWEKHRN
eukprot:6008301-Amphidinium_carterae.1